MPIPITGLFEPSGGPGAFDLYAPEDLQEGEINVALQAVAGGAFKGGIDATAPVGEVVVQVRTQTGVPNHTATKGTPCWNSADEMLYVNNDGATDWSEVSGGGGASQLSDLTDVNVTTPTSGNVLRADGVDWESAQLAHTDLSAIGTHTHAQIDTHVDGSGSDHSDVAANTAARHDRSHAVTGASDHTAGNWKTLYTNSSGQVVELANSATAGDVLNNGGAAAAPAWQACTGSGDVVRATSPTIVTPTIASFAYATHDHDDTAGGGPLAAAIREDTFHVHVEDPQDGDVIPIGKIGSTEWTLTRVTWRLVAGTCSINLYESETESKEEDVSGGTAVWSVDKSVTSTIGSTTSFNIDGGSGDIAARRWLLLQISSPSSAATLHISGEYVRKSA